MPAVLHALAWLLMIAAMMLPTVLPLLGVVQRVASGRRDAGAVIALLVAGYSLAWTAFGTLAFGVDALIRDAGAVRRRSRRTGPGSAQPCWQSPGLPFSALQEYRCLDRCRTPFGFVLQHWHGRSAARDGLRIGVMHGVFCVGCCWALMLVMFVVGMGNLGWMLLLAALMAAEKNLPHGHRIAAPVGIGLLAWATALAVAHA